MKLHNIRLPILMAASVMLCVIVAAFSAVVINSADNSMMEEQIAEHKASMQQTAAKVQKNINAKYDVIVKTADAMSGENQTFQSVYHPKELQTCADNGGFLTVLLANSVGMAYDSEGEFADIGRRDYYLNAMAGNACISERLKSLKALDTPYVVVYAAPVYADGNVIAVLCGVASAEMELTDYTDYAVNPYSGMYILNAKGELVMSSPSNDGSSFYVSVQKNKYADGTDDGYRELESADTEAAGDEGSETTEPQTGEASSGYTQTTDFYAGDISNSQSVLGILTSRQKTGSIYFKKLLDHNGWTLIYVRSVNLPESTVSFLILVRLLLLAIVLIFLAAMIIMLLLQWHSSKKITELAYTDEVTGRANWQKFVITGNRLLNRPGWWTSHYAVLHIDINRFTMYNDYYGHKAGDRMLRYLAETIDLMCSAKEIAARRSTDKFVVLWACADRAELEKRVQDLFALVKDGPNSSRLSLSVGAYELGEEDKELESAVDLAKMAQQSNPETKANTLTFFDETLRQVLTDEHDMEKLMQSALENGEFKLFLQPKHCVSDGSLGGAEALVRWVSPVKGFISPGKFIPLFEKNGFVSEVDHYMLEQLCIFQQKRLKGGRKTIPISVNVSRVQLSNPHLAETICSIVDKYKVPHRYIDIELTESACFDDMDVMIQTILSLRSMGFPVSMDDFGSGYSSLNLLKELPFDTLKIDGEFFRHATDLQRANVVVTNIINLAKSLNMTVVAEGVETDEQVAFLRTTECDLIQGYYYSKPIPAKEFEDYMTKHTLHETC